AAPLHERPARELLLGRCHPPNLRSNDSPSDATEAERPSAADPRGLADYDKPRAALRPSSRERVRPPVARRPRGRAGWKDRYSAGSSSAGASPSERAPTFSGSGGAAGGTTSMSTSSSLRRETTIVEP